MPTRNLSKEHEVPLHQLRGKIVTSALCDLLRCLGVHHFLKLVKLLLQKTFKWAKGIFSQLWVNMSTYFFLNPPVVLFSVNIVIFALILTFISLYAKVVEVSESGEEWKGFLQSFSKLELCIVPFGANSTTKPQTTPKASLRTQMGTHSIPISLSISPTSEFVVIPQDHFHLSTSMYGRHIGLEGEDSQAIINVSLSFRHTWNSSTCDGSKLVSCQFEHVVGCITFQGPKNIFPENKHVEHCSKELRRPQGDHYYAGLNWQVPDVNPLYYCRSRSMIKATFDEFLSETNSEKVIEPSARFHLLSASFFLTIFVVVVILYAALNNHNRSRHPPYLRRISMSSAVSDTAS